MKKNTIILKQSELIELLTETITKIQEQSEDRITSQEQFREVIKNIEKLYGPKEDNSKGEDEVIEEQGMAGGMAGNTNYGSGQGYQIRTTGTINKPQNPFKAEDNWYHYVIDAISLIAYLVCGITVGIGCVVSVIADICNALLYVYTKEDYYMAGMQLAFAIVPAGEALKYAAKPLKKPLTVVFKAAWNQVKVDSKILAKEVSRLTPSQLKLARKIFPKSLGKKLNTQFKSALSTAKEYYKVIPGLETMMTYAGVLIRTLVIFIEMVWYDPEFTGGLLKIVGEWAGIEKLKSWGEAMEDWPKYGVKLANKIYESMGIGGIRALVTTSIADCNNTIYTWEHVTEQWITQNSLDVLDEEEFEKDWWNGWRPPAQIEGGASGPRNIPDSEDTEAMETIKEEYAIYTQYAAMKGCKKMTEGATYGPWLTSCTKFKSMYDVLEPDERFKMLLYFISADEDGEC